MVAERKSEDSSPFESAVNNASDFFKDATIGSAKLLALSDINNIRSSRRRLEQARQRLAEVYGGKKVGIESITAESELRMVELTGVAVDMQYSRHLATVRGYFTAKQQLDKLISDFGDDQMQADQTLSDIFDRVLAAKKTKRLRVVE